MKTVIGWLFGLTATPAVRIAVSNVTVREMSLDEKDRILCASNDFFAKDTRIWANCINTFPLVFEKKVPDECLIGAIDSVGLVFSLLAPGEVRTPVVWSISESGSVGMASDSQIIDCFYRWINGKFQSVEFDLIERAALSALEKLKHLVSSSPYQHLDEFLIDRLFESKEHVLKKDGPGSIIIGRAADICIGLESLYAEGAGEVQFKLALSVAWLLEPNPERREQIVDAVKDVYNLRSKVVHGGNVNHRPLKIDVVESVICVDRLFRRSILVQLLNKFDEHKWKDTFKKVRLGLPVQLDIAEWA